MPASLQGPLWLSYSCLGCLRLATDRRCSGGCCGAWLLTLPAPPQTLLLFSGLGCRGFLRQHWSSASLGTAGSTPDVAFIY